MQDQRPAFALRGPSKPIINDTNLGSEGPPAPGTCASSPASVRVFHTPSRCMVASCERRRNGLGACTAQRTTYHMQDTPSKDQDVRFFFFGVSHLSILGITAEGLTAWRTNPERAVSGGYRRWGRLARRGAVGQATTVSRTFSSRPRYWHACSPRSARSGVRNPRTGRWQLASRPPGVGRHWSHRMGRGPYVRSKRTLKRAPRAVIRGRRPPAVYPVANASIRSPSVMDVKPPASAVPCGAVESACSRRVASAFANLRNR